MRCYSARVNARSVPSIEFARLLPRLALSGVGTPIAKCRLTCRVIGIGGAKRPIQEHHRAVAVEERQAKIWGAICPAFVDGHSAAIWLTSRSSIILAMRGRATAAVRPAKTA